MKKALILLAAALSHILALQAAVPVVSNVSAAQRAGSKLVDIHYDVADADGGTLTIGVEVSGDAGASYIIPVTALSGNVGMGIAPGSNKSIVWNAGVDWDGQYVPNAKVRVTAYDGSTPVAPAGMAYIPAGPFQMGDSFYEIGIDTLPLHVVQVDGFFMDKFEVTKELWQSVQAWGAGHGYSINAGNAAGSGHPIQSVTWYDCVKWCNARSEKDGLTPCYCTDDAQTIVYRTGNLDLANTNVRWSANGYRLPTEAEWEKAARGGSLGYRYPWGNSVANHQANYSGSGDPFEGGNPPTTPVGYYNGAQVPAGVDMANGFGLYDMAGNLYEWCWDTYSSGYYGDPTANTNPHGPATATIIRVLRGGSWINSASELRCALRSSSNYNVDYNNYALFGLRCARGL